jgi:ribosomal-protein-alanine N-acetyltransferase
MECAASPFEERVYVREELGVKEFFHAAICDSCNQFIFGTRYKCLCCVDFGEQQMHNHFQQTRAYLHTDLCQDCFVELLSEARNVHAVDHCFVKAVWPLKELQGNERELLKIDLFGTANHNENELHPELICDGCEGSILGLRYTCLNCFNVDLCVTCESKGIKITREAQKYSIENCVHLPGHMMIVTRRLLPTRRERMLPVFPLNLLLEPELKFVPRTIVDAVQLNDDESNAFAPSSKRDADPRMIRISNESEVVRMLPSHVNRVVSEIERHSFATPYSVNDFHRLLRGQDIVCLLCVHRGLILGYIALRLAHSANVISVACSPAYRGCGVGEKLMHYAIDLCKQRKVAQIQLHVNVHNKSAQKLYAKLGFRTVKWASKYYATENHDALRMLLDLPR